MATAALLLAGVTACTNSDGGEPSPTPSAASTSTSPTTSTTTTAPPSDSEIASQAASDLVRSYYAVRDQLRQSPKIPLNNLKVVATSSELSALQKLLKRERQQGLHQTGDTQIAELMVQTVSLDNADPQGGDVPTVQVDVCYDVSDADLLDKSGKSVVNADRAETGWIRYSVANYEWDTDPSGAWRVASSQNIERTPCAAS
ncbi:hypothetical protein [Nocardioides sp.]|uniref:hypothetical protein n=1 Tax=Nocardioides sp. TaxID=35761 RepID=UPI003D099F98